MFIDLKKIKRSGKEREDFFFEYRPERELSDIPQVEVKPPVKFTGSVELTGEHEAFVSGELDFTVAGECTRCLDMAERRFVVPVAESVSADGEDAYPLVNDTVDLGKIADDAILTNLPLNFLCDENCKGLCPVCGQNLNRGSCDCLKKQ